MTIDLALITLEDFKARYKRDFLYLPVYDQGKGYFVGDVVYYGDTGKFYKAKVDNPVALPSNDWQLLTNEYVDDYISDQDLEIGRTLAIGDYHSVAFGRDTIDYQKEAYLLLWAFYLVRHIGASERGLDGGTGGMASKSLDGVSVSYTGVQDGSSYDYLDGNQYGKSYLALLDPRVVGSNIQIASVF